MRPTHETEKERTYLLQTHDQRTGKALSALWLKGADPGAIDYIVSTSKSLAELEARARRWRFIPPADRRVKRAA